jgi:hypothetical protein
VCIPECSKQRWRSAAADCPVTYKAKGVQRAEIRRYCIKVCVCAKLLLPLSLPQSKFIMYAVDVCFVLAG